MSQPDRLPLPLARGGTVWPSDRLPLPLGGGQTPPPPKPKNVPISGCTPVRTAPAATVSTCLRVHDHGARISTCQRVRYRPATDIGRCWRLRMIPLPPVAACTRITLPTAAPVARCYRIHNAALPLLGGCYHGHNVRGWLLRRCVAQHIPVAVPLRGCHRLRYPVAPLLVSCATVHYWGKALRSCHIVRYRHAVRPPCEYYPIPLPPPPPDLSPCRIRPPSDRLPLPFARRRISRDSARLALPLRCWHDGNTNDLPILPGYIMHNKITADLNGEPLDLLALTLTTDTASYCWQGDITLSPASFAKLNIDGRTAGDEAVITIRINGNRWDILAEDYRDTRKFIGHTYTVTGRSITAKLGADYAKGRHSKYDAARYARQIADEQLNLLPYRIAAWEAVACRCLAAATTDTTCAAGCCAAVLHNTSPSPCHCAVAIACATPSRRCSSVAPPSTTGARRYAVATSCAIAMRCARPASITPSRCRHRRPTSLPAASVRRPNWLIPGDTYTVSGQTPIEVIADLARAAGGFVESHPYEAQLFVRPVWRQPAWAKPTPALTIPANLILSVSGQRRISERCNAVRLTPAAEQIGGAKAKGGLVYREGTDQQPEASTLTHAAYTDTDVMRAAGIHALSETGTHKIETVQLPWAEKYQLPLASLGAVWAFAEQGQTWQGIIKGVSVAVELDGGAPVVTQTVTIDRYLGD